MFCENCGHKVPNDADFCPNCGHNIKHYHSIFFNSLNLKSKWNQFSNGKKAISLVAIVLIGFILFNGIFGFFTPHEDESNVDDYNTYYYSDYDDLDTDESESYTTTLIEEETYEDTSDSSSSSSDYSDTQDDSYSYDSGGSYVGSVNSDKFHYSSCGQAQKIKSGNLVTFSSRDDAISRGYSPCSFCSP